MGTQDLVKIATFCSISLRNFEIFFSFFVQKTMVQPILWYWQGYRYGLSYRPIPITDTDKHFPYRQNRYICRYRYYRPIPIPIMISVAPWQCHFKKFEYWLFMIYDDSIIAANQQVSIKNMTLKIVSRHYKSILRLMVIHEKYILCTNKISKVDNLPYL